MSHPECPYPLYGDAESSTYYCWVLFDNYTSVSYKDARDLAMRLDETNEQFTLALLDTKDKLDHLLSTEALKDIKYVYN